jgi:hypothetical protein
MLKIVPTAPLTSMFDEPSSGSKSTAYLPARYSVGIEMISSSSSDAMTQTRPVWFMAFLRVSLAKTSSFCCSSPWTFTAPAAPRMLTSPARRIAAATILVPRAMS